MPGEMSDPRAMRQIAAMANLAPSEEALTEADEPPDQIDVVGDFCWSPPRLCASFMRPPPKVERRESLLTRQLHSETEPTDNEAPRSPTRSLSTRSTWSSISMPSTAELTSDDGHSVPSTAGSPPIPPSRVHNPISTLQKPLEQKVKIVGHDSPPTATVADKTTNTAEEKVEANLGRKRCISFACRGKQESKPTPPAPTPAPAPAPAQASTPSPSPPKRKCALKFVCPSRAEKEDKPAERILTKRPVSPPPPARRSPAAAKHRGSDSTVTHVSPRVARKVPEVQTIPQDKPLQMASTRVQTWSDESDDDSGDEATRFHAFATSDDEPEGWTKMSTCYRNRLTVDDTLRKEKYIRKTCEEAEEEVLEEEEEEEEEELSDELAAVAEMEDDDVVDDADDTDEGFHSDDEGGFASSDSDSDDDSDFEWWKPSGLSTAATSVDQLDRLAIVNSKNPTLGTSLGSASSSPTSPRTSHVVLRKLAAKHRATPAMNINKPAAEDLPDSTDFVCGTLDEDRTLEEEFINRRKQKEAAKRPIRPQDIDPSFPTSDPEMDEEDDDDVDEVLASNNEAGLMHGGLDEIDGHGTARRISPIRRPRARSNVAKSPAPTAVRHHSPAPIKQRATCHSPPPTAARRNIARSPAPTRRLFVHSPKRVKSPAPVERMTSPPNSPTDLSARRTAEAHGLGGRPHLPTRTSSLPRGGATKLSNLATIPSDDEETNDDAHTDVPKRGAIDIVKGLEKKRSLRKKKLAQKMCAKAANKGEKPHKVKPGIGAERMREVGLQLQEYHGKAEHILSL